MHRKFTGYYEWGLWADLWQKLPKLSATADEPTATSGTKSMWFAFLDGSETAGGTFKTFHFVMYVEKNVSNVLK